MDCMEMYTAVVAATKEMASLPRQVCSAFLLGTAQKCLVTQRCQDAPQEHGKFAYGIASC